MAKQKLETCSPFIGFHATDKHFDHFIRPASPGLQAGDKGVVNGITTKVP